MSKFIHGIGALALGKLRTVINIAAVCAAVIRLSVHVRFWPRTVRSILGRQILFTGIDALSLVLTVGFLAGLTVVTQAQSLLDRFGQSEMMGSILVTVIIREIGPLLVNFIVIGRSGTAVATELANMRANKEIEVLQAQGIDPMVYLVMPRALGMMISVLALAVFFVIISFISGYSFGVLVGVQTGDPAKFISVVLKNITLPDFMTFLAKTIIPGLMTGVIACYEGLNISGMVTEVPQATTRAVVRSIGALLVVSAAVSILTYL